LTVSLLEEKGYDPMVYRLFCLLSHYRKPLEFSWEGLDNVVAVYDKLMNRIAGLSEEGTIDYDEVASFEKKFAEAMGNDMNTSSAITVLYDMLKADISDATKRHLVVRFDEVLSLQLARAWEKKEESVDSELAAYVEKKIEERKAAKKEKDFARADEIRSELEAKGIVLKDTREGTLWSMK
ncbi:MAG: cysteine--tRNA ligase, partial [Eubacterium sp.]|nr:cysteine--tRNA ligase [Eubacterium sp.]